MARGLGPGGTELGWGGQPLPASRPTCRSQPRLDWMCKQAARNVNPREKRETRLQKETQKKKRDQFFAIWGVRLYNQAPGTKKGININLKICVQNKFENELNYGENERNFVAGKYLIQNAEVFSVKNHLVAKSKTSPRKKREAKDQLKNNSVKKKSGK